MRIGILLVDTFIVFIFTFIYCCLKLSSMRSIDEDNN